MLHIIKLSHKAVFFMYIFPAVLCFLQALTVQIEQLREEQREERRRSKEEALQWQREKVGFMSLWSAPLWLFLSVTFRHYVIIGTTLHLASF